MPCLSIIEHELRFIEVVYSFQVRFWITRNSKMDNLIQKA